MLHEEMKTRRLFLALYIMILLLTIWLIPDRWSLQFILSLQTLDGPYIRIFFQALSKISSLVAICTALAMLAVGWQKRKPLWMIKALFIGCCLITAGLLSYGTKVCVGKQRPFHIMHAIHKWGDGGGYSFPSGHTTEAVTLALAVGIVGATSWQTGLAICWALLVMLSRMFLGVHDPVDILGGMLIATLSVCLCVGVVKWGLHNLLYYGTIRGHHRPQRAG